MRKTISIRGRQVTYVDVGNGPAALLIHGFPLDHRLWQHQFDELSEHFRLLAPDLPGFGRSEAVESFSSIDDFATWCFEFLEASHVASPVHLIGLSMGGYIIFSMLRSSALPLAKVVLVNTKAADDPPEVRRGREIMAAKVESEGKHFVADAMLPKLFARANLREAPDEVALVREMIKGTTTGAIQLGQRAMASRKDSTDLLPAIGRPVCVIAGEDDSVTPATEAKKWSAQIPNARFVSVDEAGHLSPLENPTAFNAAALRFLLDQGKSPAP